MTPDVFLQFVLITVTIMDSQPKVVSAAPDAAQYVSIKAPQFLEAAAAGFFAILEAQFHLRGITSSETMYFHSLAALPPETVMKIPSSVLAAHDFPSLKESVLALYKESKPELMEKLLSSTRLVGRPSTFLADISRMANQVGVGEDLVRHRFVQALPSNIAVVVAAQQDLTLAQIGKLADELMPLASRCLAAPATPRTESSARASSNQQVSPGVQPFHPEQKPKVCRAHIFYGAKARNCRPWCQWPDKGHVEIRPSSRASSPLPPSSRGSSPRPPGYRSAQASSQEN